jgi:hypothetical protein
LLDDKIDDVTELLRKKFEQAPTTN